MASLAEYFSKNRYLPKYEFGTRIIGQWNKIPFVGTVYNDSVISPDQGPRLSIQLDLPIVVNKQVVTRIIDTHKNFKGLKLLKEPSDLVDTETKKSTKKSRK